MFGIYIFEQGIKVEDKSGSSQFKELADTVSELKEIKHVYKVGV